MLSWGKTVLERTKLECKGFLSYVFKDISFPPECDYRIKIKTLSSIISPPSTQILFSFFSFGYEPGEPPLISLRSIQPHASHPQ